MEDFKDFLVEVMLPVLGITLIVIVVVTALVVIPSSYASCKQSEVYNTIHETEYTCSDFFWASSQINSNTQTVNLNN